MSTLVATSKKPVRSSVHFVDIMPLGARLTELRTDQGLSMRKVASDAGISVAYLSKLERDETSNPSIEVLEGLARALKVDLPELRPSAGVTAVVELPESLQKFVDENQNRFPELVQKDWQDSLARVRLRGRYPETSRDWMSIFIAMRGALENDE